MYYNFPNSLQRVEAVSEKEAAAKFFKQHPAKDYITVMSGFLKESFFNWKDFECSNLSVAIEELEYLEQENEVFYSVEAFRKYAQFEGDADRREFWHFFVFNLILFCLIGIIEKLMGTSPFASIFSFTTLFTVFVTIPFFAVTVRRLHDIGKTGWFSLLWFLPVFGTIFLLFWMAKPGSSIEK